MAAIRLQQLRFYTCHGALPQERETPQEFFVDVDITVDITSAGQSDQLSDTVNYAAIARTVEEIMMGPAVTLLETLATRLRARIRLVDTRIQAVRVAVTKVNPPLAMPSSGVQVIVSDD